jgi:hypothetical protein
MTISGNMRMKNAKSTWDGQLQKDAKRSNERHPSTEYEENTKPQYPLNRVSTYPDGTEIHIDSTPGHSRYEVRHSSGNIMQMADDGMTTTITVGNRHDYMKEGLTLTVDQNGDIRIGGHARVVVQGGAFVEVLGDTNLVTTGNMVQFVGGNLNTVVGGDHNMQISGNYNLTSKNNTTTVKGDHQTDTSGTSKETVGGTMDKKSGGTMTKVAPKIDLNP